MKPPVFYPIERLKHNIKECAKILWLHVSIQVGCALATSLLGVLAAAAAGFLFQLFSHHLQVYPSQVLFWFRSLSSLFTSGLTLFSTVAAGLLTCSVLARHYGWKLTSFFQSDKRFSGPDVVKGVCLLMLASFTVGMLFNLISMILFHRSGLFNYSPLTGMTGNFFSVFCTFTAVVIAAPILEELLFRGIMLRIFKSWKPYFGMLFTSFCFGLLHLNFSQGIPAFFMGLILAYYALKSGSIRECICIHAVNNFISFIGLYSSGFSSLLIMILAAAGLMFAALSFSKLKICLQKMKDCFSSLIFYSGWMKAFIVLFFVCSLGLLAAGA